jgi:glutamine synthetase
LYGIANRIEPEPIVTGNAYEQAHPEYLALPESLSEAAARFRQSQAARELFGNAFVEHFAASRVWESTEYRKHVSDWELARYFEII